MAQNLCPVCGFDGLGEPAYDGTGCASFEMCPFCGVEFGYDDSTRTHEELRAAWVARGMRWWSSSIAPPAEWNPEEQLRRLGFLLKLRVSS